MLMIERSDFLWSEERILVFEQNKWPISKGLFVLQKHHKSGIQMLKKHIMNEHIKQSMCYMMKKNNKLLKKKKKREKRVKKKG